MQPQRFPMERVKIAFIISLLTGKVLQWAETIWQQSDPITQTVEEFTNYFWEVFGEPADDTSIGDHLYHLQQGKLSISEYALKFRTE